VAVGAEGSLTIVHEYIEDGESLHPLPLHDFIISIYKDPVEAVTDGMVVDHAAVGSPASVLAYL